MKQPTLMDRPVSATEPLTATVVETELAMSISELPKESTSALLDFRTGYMMSSPATMRQALADYVEIRDEFRKWLLARLVLGVHYGEVPGCEIKWCDAKGKPCPKVEATHTLGFKGAIVPLEQWRPKPSLYKAGAEMVCDLLWARADCQSDIDAWKMMGSKEGVLVRTCRLYSKITGELLGQGTGSRLVGQKGGDNNNAIKMADKNATVSAVLNTWGLSDLFSLDDEVQPPHENPEPKANAPVSPARSDRVTKDEVTEIVASWKNTQPDPANADPEKFQQFVERATGSEFNARRWQEWTPAFIERARTALKEGRT